MITGNRPAAHRHMHEYGTTSEDLAEISVATRLHATRNPEAVKAMTDLQFMGVGEITVKDVLDSRMIADPLHLLECCMQSDGGGAVVIASAAAARGAKKNPIWIIGTGEATKYRSNGGDITRSAAQQGGPIAFAEAQVTPQELDIAMIYDSFTITVATILEDLGFCKKGEYKDFAKGGRFRFDNPLKPTLNTDGGGLSSNHPGMRGIFLLVLESVRQLRGESTSQPRTPAQRSPTATAAPRWEPLGRQRHPGQGLTRGQRRSTIMPDRPQPRFPEPNTQAYWEAAKNGQLTYQTCNDCNTVVFTPRVHCTGCGGNNLKRESSPRAKARSHHTGYVRTEPAFAPSAATSSPGSTWTRASAC
jgi:hypothetical protein